ncbi:hypothetical protein [Streptomyces acidiscabies]|uniref:hypothetical protein n=1 Tax=Streptomyces acidiscabies TaxID=42234 RepID=UPI0038F7F798
MGTPDLKATRDELSRLAEAVRLSRDGFSATGPVRAERLADTQVHTGAGVLSRT